MSGGGQPPLMNTPGTRQLFNSHRPRRQGSRHMNSPTRDAPLWQLPNTLIKSSSTRLLSEWMDFFSWRGQEVGERRCGLVCNHKPLPGRAAGMLQLLGRGGDGEGTGQENKRRSSHHFATFLTAALCPRTEPTLFWTNWR